MGCFQMRSPVVLIVTILLLLLACLQASPSSQLQKQHQNHIRKMLNASASTPATGGGGGIHSSRRVDVYGCSRPEELVTVSQNSDPILHTGVPAYTVQITNTCIDCAVCDVHLSCGDFANTELVDPATFRRLGFDDCLVKDGGPVGPGELISFQYANSFIYEMKVASAACNCA
ncbi:TPD1 protein homolog 1B [Lolium perenne]|uniref:TPD1 protein homolog 1B n=1 Tax=Lolium perenne TaxID=4522 RepID=UPI0021EA842C|nr:TPD1 protein homolog 1B-like [Lolium perenne]